MVERHFVQQVTLQNKGLKPLKVTPGSFKQILVSLAIELYLCSEDDKFPTAPRL